MAQYTCSDCGHSDHFSEFKSGSHVEEGELEDVEVDEVECPECGSENASED
jgi:DNA-directed RNA polymerase subunit RPC12/RpoP